MLFPKPKDYLPDKFLEHKNAISYASLPALSKSPGSVFDIPGLQTALEALEAQRKRDFKDWLDNEKLDFIAFPSVGDVARSDLEENLKSAEHALRNGVKYSNGNRAIRHLGEPSVSVCMGTLEGSGMPVNLTFLGEAGEDGKLIGVAGAFEGKAKRRVAPGLTPGLGVVGRGAKMSVKLERGKVVGTGRPKVWVNGVKVDVKREGDAEEFEDVVGERGERPEGRTVVGKDVVLVVGATEDGHTDAEMFLV
jgi:hypothetical protein